jgi:hypothetical protein
MLGQVGLTRMAFLVFGALSLSFQAAGAPRLPLLPDEASAVSAACNWNGKVHARTRPAPIQGKCDYRSATLHGRVWWVFLAPECPPQMTCMDGGSVLKIDKWTGQVVDIVYDA